MIYCLFLNGMHSFCASVLYTLFLAILLCCGGLAYSHIAEVSKQTLWYLRRLVGTRYCVQAAGDLPEAKTLPQYFF